MLLLELVEQLGCFVKVNDGGSSKGEDDKRFPATERVEPIEQKDGGGDHCHEQLTKGSLIVAVDHLDRITLQFGVTMVGGDRTPSTPRISGIIENDGKIEGAVLAEGLQHLISSRVKERIASINFCGPNSNWAMDIFELAWVECSFWCWRQVRRALARLAGSSSRKVVPAP